MVLSQVSEPPEVLFLQGWALLAAKPIRGSDTVLASPSVRLRGRRVIGTPLVSTQVARLLVVQAVTVGISIRRRHFPICITRGMLAPEGALVRVNAPSAPVMAAVMGSPYIAASSAWLSGHWSQVAPWVMAGSVWLGTKTTTL